MFWPCNLKKLEEKQRRRKINACACACWTRSSRVEKVEAPGSKLEVIMSSNRLLGFCSGLNDSCVDCNFHLAGLNLFGIWRRQFRRKSQHRRNFSRRYWSTWRKFCRNPQGTKQSSRHRQKGQPYGLHPEIIKILGQNVLAASKFLLCKGMGEAVWQMIEL